MSTYSEVLGWWLEEFLTFLGYLWIIRINHQTARNHFIRRSSDLHGLILSADQTVNTGREDMVPTPHLQPDKYPLNTSRSNSQP